MYTAGYSTNTIRFLLLLIFSLTTLFSCSKDSTSTLKNGRWHATLIREDGNNIPFTFRVESKQGQQYIAIENAKENLRVDALRQVGDSLFITMPLFDSDFKLKIVNSRELEGTWTKYFKDYKEQMPFKAIQKDRPRITTYAQPKADVSGNWDTEFPNGELNLNAIGAFDQKGNTVTGTFLTPAGDFRYLEGIVSGDTLKLSGFDGGHASLWTALIQDSLLTHGNFYSINTKPIAWQSVRSQSDQLPDAYAGNTVKAGTVKADFSFKDMRTNELISISDERYKGKVVLVDFLGSWCPNCYDETKYLIDYYNKNQQRGFEILGLDFERHAEFAPSLKAMNASFFKRFDIPYPILHSGVSSTDRELTEKVFPNLPQKIRAFPTLVFVDKQGYVRKIHSGFNGPATGKYYTEFKEEFNQTVNALLSE